MPLVHLNCPSCGAPLELDDSRLFGFCSFCGTKTIIDVAGSPNEIEASKKINESSGNPVVDQFRQLTDSNSMVNYNSFSYNRNNVCDAI